MAAAKGTKKTKQRFPKEREIRELLETTKRERVDEFSFAQRIFEVFVDPAAMHCVDPAVDEVLRMNAAFSEWLLYDCDIFDGLTLFELHAEDDPTLEECALTQFYSRFWVVDQDRQRGRVTLRDIPTRRDFVVRSPHIARIEHWGTGTLGTRIARVRGVWKEIGQVALHDNAPSNPLPACKGRRRHIQRDPAAFIVNVEQVIGRHGAFVDTVRSFEL